MQIEQQFGPLPPGAVQDMAQIEANYLSGNALFSQEMIEGAARDPRRQQAVSQWLGAVAKAALDIKDFRVFYDALNAQTEFNRQVDTLVLRGGPTSTQTNPWTFGQNPRPFGPSQVDATPEQLCLVLLSLLWMTQQTANPR